MRRKDSSAGSRTTCLLCIAAIVGMAQPARAYVCSRVPDSAGNPAGASTAWFTRNISRSYNRTGTVTLNRAQTFSTFDAAFAVWQNITLRASEDPTCVGAGTNINFGSAAKRTTQAFVGYNFLAPDTNENVLLFRDSGWSHEKNVIALTTTTYNSLTGEIFDADIEFNSQYFTFTIGDTDVQTDLLNTAVHEIGHFQGFAHSLDPNATMYAEASLHDVQKRALSCDDASILVFRYPANSTQVGYCDPPSVSCGYCAKPGTLSAKATITVRNSDDGKGGCQASRPGTFGVLLSALAIARLRRMR